MKTHFGILAVLFLANWSYAEDKGPQQWTGAIEDLKLKEGIASIIVTEADFKKLFESWKFAKELPKVDFKKNVVVIATTVGSRLNGKPVLKDGDLTFPAISTRDLRPGFRYLIVEFPKEGVKTFNGKELPKQ